MKILCIGILLYCLSGFSCTHSSTGENAKQEKLSDQHQPYQKPPTRFIDTLVINKASAVFFAPDSAQLEKIKQATGVGAFESNMHEFEFLTKTARIVIQRNMPHLHIYEATHHRYLLFVKNDSNSICIDLDTKSDPYGLFFFDNKKDPLYADLANIDTDLGFYFAK